MVAMAISSRNRTSEIPNGEFEWSGKPVKSTKKALKTAAKLAGIDMTVSPVLRHSAAVRAAVRAAVQMAEDRREMEDIRQFLGHSDIETKRKIDARFSPEYLKEAAATLEIDDLAPARKCRDVGSRSNGPRGST